MYRVQMASTETHQMLLDLLPQARILFLVNEPEPWMVIS